MIQWRIVLRKSPVPQGEVPSRPSAQSALFVRGSSKGSESRSRSPALGATGRSCGNVKGKKHSITKQEARGCVARSCCGKKLLNEARKWPICQSECNLEPTSKPFVVLCVRSLWGNQASGSTGSSTEHASKHHPNPSL